MKIVLLIDTTSNQEIKVGLVLNKESFEVEKKLDKRKAQEVLSMIEKILEKRNLKLKDISEIKVNTGPGSFTGIRVGLTIANTLAFLLKVPVNEKPIGQFDVARYI